MYYNTIRLSKRGGTAMSMDKFINEYEAAPLTKKAYGQSLGLFQRFLGQSEPTEEKVEEYIHKLQEEGRHPPLSTATWRRSGHTSCG